MERSDLDESERRACAFLARAGLCASGVSPSLRLASAPSDSNVTFEARCGAERYAVRVPFARVEGAADFASERAATEFAARLGIGAALAAADEAGFLATRWIDGAVPLSPRRLREDPALIERCGALLAKLHRSGARLPRAIEDGAILDDYRGRLPAERLAALWSAEVEAAIEAARRALAEHRAESAPRHGDAAPANFLSTSAGLALIDWEYAAMGDPAWDVGTLACEGDFDESALIRLVSAYGAAAMTVERARAAMILAAAVNLLWTALRHDVPTAAATIGERRRRLHALAARSA